ncbi:hypothetical protein BVER_03528 [Candidatus Burkholderia verschuerenii]|uniref:Integrase n=1 Tax=Candidatus Burkholderia verschuerenii TaxID=242163 RepID=A0A0L0M8G0_9BURK|nr:hypothetical protein BVER_03528 [Candidatus Burkholderia verschuerenii]
MPLHTIARLYYDPESSPQATTTELLERYLRDMRDELVRLAEHGVGLWFRPLIAKRLAGEGIRTLGELVARCNTHGGTWWRSVPRIGPYHARTIVAWLRRHEASIGVALEADIDTRELVPAAGSAIVIGGPPERPHLASFERMAVPANLSGGEGTHGGRRGDNRATGFAYIRAPHDLAALHAWLHRYRDRPATLRAYTREVERFVLWAVIVRGAAVSSVTVEDCEAYKDFLAVPTPAFTGPRRSRTGVRWRPFTGALSVDSQAYAVRVLRAAFAWLVDVRYLAGNPWHAVQDPATIVRETPIAVHRALPARLWAVLRAELQQLADGETDVARQWRIARAAILLMGDSGPRRGEVAAARREGVRLDTQGVASGQPPMWTLSVTGKGRRARTMPLSPATVEALREHWRDRGRDFDATDAAGPLIVTLVTLATRSGREKLERHAEGDAPYQVDALGVLVRSASRRLVRRLATHNAVTAAELKQLAGASAHAFRHTFGTQAAACAMPTDVVQAILGHASLQTTSIYVRAEQRRMLEAAAQYYADSRLEEPLRNESQRNHTQ